jgi:hypothetical protein
VARIASDEPGPGQKYAIEARKSIKALQQSRQEVEIEIRWCPAHEGIEGNEKTDEWAKLAAEEPDAHGVEWLRRADAADATAQISREPQARDLRKEVGGSETVKAGSLPGNTGCGPTRG